MKWIGQNIYDQVSKFKNTVDFSKDVTFYQPVNNADPGISIGASDDERLRIKVFYQGTASQSAQIFSFKTFTESGTAHDGRFHFEVDEDPILRIQDGGIDFFAGKGIGINGVDILTDNGSGTATLSNIDALDATTIATFETAMEANLDTFGSQMTSASSLATIGTITTGVWNGTAVASAYLDADTAHLEVTQTFLGVKTFALPIISDGDRTLVPGDGAAIHVDAFDVTDGTTSAHGTAAKYAHVKIENPRLLASNLSVTTTDASTLYIKGPPIASTNQTITNAYSLFVDDGDVKFDADLIVGGDIDLEGDIDVNGTLETDALTIAGATIAAIGTTAITTLGTIGTGVWNGTAIAHAYIGADAIEGDNIADDAVDSEHYTDGSIDTAHIADDQVTFAKALGVTPNVFGNVIKLIPSDFMANDDGGNTKFGVGYVETAGSGYGMRPGNNAVELFAFVSIPQGMTATHVDIFDKNDVGIIVYEAQINATTMVSKGTGNCNTTVDITDVASTATNFLAIQVTTTSVNDKVYGGTVTIA